MVMITYKQSFLCNLQFVSFFVLFFVTHKFLFIITPSFFAGSEVLTGKVRVLYSSLGTCLGFAIGYMILPLLAYFLRDWKSLSLALSLPCVAYVPFWW